MTVIDIVSVTVSQPVAEQLQGRNIEIPKKGSQFETDTFLVVGWVLGQSSPVQMVEIIHDGKVIQSTSLNVQRPDVVTAFPDAHGTEQSGFRTTVTAPKLDDFKLVLEAVLEDGNRIVLGQIVARRSLNGEAQVNEVTDREESRPKAGFFRRVFGLGGG